MPRTPATALALLPLLAFLGACATELTPRDLGGLYSRAASSDEDGRAPVVVLPGILGSKLKDLETGTLVWGAFAGDFADPRSAEGLRQIAHPMAIGAPLYELRDDVVEDGALDRVRANFLFVPVELSAYKDILQVLGAGGYRDEDLSKAGAIDYGTDHYTCFQRAYDWRRSIAEAARALEERVTFASLEASLRRDTDEPVKVDIVAHSMGGLVARYYLRYGAQPLPEDGSLPELTWAGAEFVRKLIMVGTPNAGSAASFKQLLRGAPIGPFLPTYQPALLGTMPSIYQLLPRPRHAKVVDAETGEAIDLYDPEVWIERGWGLADPDQAGVIADMLPDVDDPAQRRDIAIDHLRKCLAAAEQFHRAIDVPATPPEGVSIHLFAGDATDTTDVIEVDDRGRLRVRAEAAGDGVVTRHSALMDERENATWTPRLRSPIDFASVNFLSESHLGLTKSSVFADNVLFLLLEDPAEAGPAGPVTGSAVGAAASASR